MWGHLFRTHMIRFLHTGIKLVIPCFPPLKTFTHRGKALGFVAVWRLSFLSWMCVSHRCMLEHGSRNDAWWSMPWGTVREAKGKKTESRLPWVPLVPWWFLPPETNICIQFIRCFFLLDARTCYRSQSAERVCWMLSSVWPESGCSLLPRFHAFSRENVWYLCLNWSVLRKLWEKTSVFIFSMCLLMFISMVFWSCFYTLKQPFSDHCLLCFIYV